jgi:hypothetical protein
MRFVVSQVPKCEGPGAPGLKRPEEKLDLDEAIALLGIVQSAIIAMLPAILPSLLPALTELPAEAGA